MIYTVRKMKIKNDGELVAVGKRSKKIVYPATLKIGGIYFLDGKNPWRIEGIEEEL